MRRYHAQNYCPILNQMQNKDQTQQRCESNTTNSLDIDINAYGLLTGQGAGVRKQDVGGLGRIARWSIVD